MSDYIEAGSQVIDLFKELTEAHRLDYLREFNIKFLFNLKERKTKGKIKLGSAEKCSSKDKAIHGFDFVIILDYAFWNANPEKRNPLLYHEMLHCGENERGEPCLVPHDLEEFGAVVRQYGAWKSDIKHFSSQLEMFEGELEAVA